LGIVNTPEFRKIKKIPNGGARITEKQERKDYPWVRVNV